ncbi:hypothetical protein JGU66_35705 [Myxococcaceae bacterium JPH2]|nr:hypothetical protein [Myxococcaceae bacterium JPH2]
MKKRLLPLMLVLLVVGALARCGQSTPDDTAPQDTTSYADVPSGAVARTSSRIKHVFVIALENHAAEQIYGSPDAPYLNEVLLPSGGHATNYLDDLPDLPSEPHYIWMEAGTNVLPGNTFTTNAAPSPSNSTPSSQHVVAQLRAAGSGLSWMSYQEGLNSVTGACPIVADGFYAPKHDPFVFFQDIAGNPPSRTNGYCAAHHRPLSALTTDVANKNVATYSFITPNLCNDMHGAAGCPDSNTVRAGDAWLRTYLPPLLEFANANAGVIFIVWDEPEATGTLPFLVLGPAVKRGYASAVPVSHSSLVKSLERIMELPVLPMVEKANDFSDYFEPDAFP